MNSHKPEPKDNQIESQSHPQNKTKRSYFYVFQQIGPRDPRQTATSTTSTRLSCWQNWCHPNSRTSSAVQNAHLLWERVEYTSSALEYLYHNTYTLVLNGPDFEVLSKGLDFCPRDRPLALRPKSRPYGLNMRFELINHFFHKTRIFELHYFHGSKYHLPSTFFSSLGNYILSAGLPCLPWEVDDPKARGWSKLNSTECFSNIFLTITDTTNKLWIHAKGALLRLSVEVPSLFCSIFLP